MSFIRNDFGNFSRDIEKNLGNIQETIKGIEDIFGEKEKQDNNPGEKANSSLPLSKDEIKAFIGLCSLEGKPVKEKIAELMKDYIEEKRKQMGK